VIRILASAALSLLGNAVALIAGSLLLAGMSLDPAGFLTALVIFTLTTVLIEPLLRQMALRSAPAILGSSALIATLVSLVVTAWLGDSLRIDGATDWILATIVVWAIGLAARLLLPLVLFKRVLAEANDR
jgi:putative membrane protein